MIKEICVENFSDAEKAVKNGANRVELCENLFVGGTTPSYGTIKLCLAKLSVPIFVMIRPRGGNFCYSPLEIEIMKEDILACKKIGAHGVVFGVLDEQNKIDYTLLDELVALAKPMQITFHKAIDEVENPEQEILKLEKSGVNRILSSGKKETAIEGQNLLNNMIEISKRENKIKIVVAGKVTFENFQEVSKLIHADEFHGKKIIKY
ncbi:MAG: copper homeostasis protein CutC [Fusobacteriaceae bacterium]